MSVAVEGKVDEAFGPTMEEWMNGASDGKMQRLDFIQTKIEIGHIPDEIRYQLLHRSTAAILEAERFAAKHAVVLIHSFSDHNSQFDDFSDFIALFGLDAQPNRVQTKELSSGIKLHFAWVEGEHFYLAR